MHVTGQLPRPEALAVASEGDIVVMPSLEDGMANGLLEGIALERRLRSPRRYSAT